MSAIKIYTDGSFSHKTKEAAIAFAVLNDAQHLISAQTLFIGSRNNSIESEMIAASKALNHIKQLKPTKINLISDSSLVVRIGNREDGDLKIKESYASAYNELIESINLFDQSKLKFSWVKGHSGNLWNTIVDRNAKRVMQKRQEGFLIPHRYWMHL